MPQNQRIRFDDGQDRAPVKESRQLSQRETNRIGGATGLLLSFNIEPELFAQKQILGSLSMANSIITRRSVFGTALDSAASIHRNRTLQVNAGRQHLVQACIHSTPSAMLIKISLEIKELCLQI